MKPIITTSIAAFVLLSLTPLAVAEALPKKTSDYKGNYQTLVNDQHATPDVATCIATAYDLTKEPKEQYDRLGFTTDELQAAKAIKANKTKAGQIIVEGTARLRNNGTWRDISVVCGLKSGQVTSLYLLHRK